MGMFLPNLSGVETQREMVGTFMGYNHNFRIAPGELYDMQNMTSDLYPLLSPRKQRARLRQLTKPNGLFAHRKLLWVDGVDLYYDGALVGQVEDSPKQFVGMGAYVLVFPDKVGYNTHTGEFFHMEQENVTTGTVSAHLCKADGEIYEDYEVGDASPSDPKEGMLWVDTSDTPHTLNVYSQTMGVWQSVPTVYVKIESTGIGAGLSAFEGVTVSGMEDETLNGDFLLQDASEDAIIVTAVIDAAIEQDGVVTVSRKVPDMDYVTECNNRIWGCSSEKHEIYACALGEPKNWHRFQGLSTDSYALTIGSPGDFTGAITHLGYVLFFKEDIIHKIYGSKPSNYQLTDTHSRGVEKESEKSLVIVNETLYYKARNDVCAYNAALPSSISAPLGLGKFSQACAGAYMGKYMISMRDEQGGGHLFAFDESKGLWHREDDTCALYMASLDGDLFMVDEDGVLWSVGGKLDRYADDTASLEGTVRFMAQFGRMGLDAPDRKYISRLQLRIHVKRGAMVRVLIRYDMESAWEEKFRFNATKTYSTTIPILPRRCDTMEIKLEGRGEFYLYSLTKTIEQGSDV